MDRVLPEVKQTTHTQATNTHIFPRYHAQREMLQALLGLCAQQQCLVNRVWAQTWQSCFAPCQEAVEGGLAGSTSTHGQDQGHGAGRWGTGPSRQSHGLGGCWQLHTMPSSWDSFLLTRGASAVQGRCAPALVRGTVWAEHREPDPFQMWLGCPFP